MTFSPAEKRDAVKGWAYSRKTWLADFGTAKSKFPAHIIEQKQRDLAVMQEIAADYARAAERDERKQA